VSFIVDTGLELGNSALETVRVLDDQIQFSNTVNYYTHELDNTISNLDKDHHITETINEYGEFAKSKVLEIDSALQISNNATLIGESIKGSINQFETEHQIAAKVNEASTAVLTGVQQGVNNVVEAINSSEVGKTGVELVTDISNTIGSAFNSWWSTPGTEENNNNQQQQNSQ